MKLLGDGAMLRFDDRDHAIAAVVELVATLPELPPCRGASQRVLLSMRNADYFGPVVNLAARLAGAVDAQGKWR